MTQSYPKAGVSVKPGTSAASADRSASRDTATFVAYYWEAYNEVVEPRRFDHYLIRKWVPDLGPLGFTLLKTLRDRCYHNPATGVLRDSCEVDMDALAASVGVSRRTLFREFENNEALGNFVRRIVQWEIIGGRPRQRPNLYQVSMDDPVHPTDMKRYDDLRAIKESERLQSPPRRIIHGKKAADTTPSANAVDYECHFGTHSDLSLSYECQNGTPDTKYLGRQNGTPETTSLPGQIGTAIDNLPPDLLTKENLTAAGAGSDAPAHRDPPINPPGGRGEKNADLPEPDPLQALWDVALGHLAGLVNAPTLKAHLRPMRLVSLTETETDTETDAVLAATSGFSRNWVEARCRAEVEAALSEARGKPVAVRFTAGGK